MNSRLPINVTVDDIKNNPQFAKLLESLTQHLTVDGGCTVSQRYVDKVQVGHFAFSVLLLVEVTACIDSHMRQWMS